jgi:hypothetical protein
LTTTEDTFILIPVGADVVNEKDVGAVILSVPLGAEIASVSIEVAPVMAPVSDTTTTLFFSSFPDASVNLGTAFAVLDPGPMTSPVPPPPAEGT